MQNHEENNMADLDIGELFSIGLNAGEIVSMSEVEYREDRLREQSRPKNSSSLNAKRV